MPGTRPSVLVTGGAGFIGSHVVELLLDRGYPVVVYDKLVDQVHGGAGPRYVRRDARFIAGDLCDRDGLKAALSGIEHVVHLAAEVGVGQSMYEICRYVEANTGGTATLLDIIGNDRTDVGRIVVASSMSVYGEGAYRCPEHDLVSPRLRGPAQLVERRWEVLCPECSRVVVPVGTPESRPLQPTSVYAITKMDQELLCLCAGQAYGLGVVALRYFNVYGPRQALGNPYTGLAAIFSARLLRGLPPLAFEDGQQLRDLIHVRDVARATVAALETPTADGEVINVGLGDPMTVVELAMTLASAMDVDVSPEITGKYRSGDIRHCYADMTKAVTLLGFRPSIPFDEGVAELIAWVSGETASDDGHHARRELERRGLVV